MLGPDWTTSLKYVGSVTAALYGLWATVTDFHEVRDGKKVLTRKGYLGIVLLIAASSLSLFSDVGKDRHDRAASKQELEEGGEMSPVYSYPRQAGARATWIESRILRRSTCT